MNNALNTLGRIVPNAAVQNLADIGVYIEQMLNNVLDILVAIASLSLIAGSFLPGPTPSLSLAPQSAAAAKAKAPKAKAPKAGKAGNTIGAS